MDLNNIKTPDFLIDLDDDDLIALASNIRYFLINHISKTGGHLSSNLGIVELTIALHKVFKAPKDKIFFDVGHQSYVHKILTGRAKDFDKLRSYNGLSGYQKISESIYDCFEGGHSSTTISAAIGMAIARDLNKENYHIVPVIGDGALINGLSFEALNHLGHLNKKIIIILNDNEMSISKNTGGLNNLLDRLRISMPYNKLKHNYKEVLNKTSIGRIMYKSTKIVKDKIKGKVVSNLFTDLGLDYIGPLDGHDFKDLIRGLEKAKKSEKPIVVHVISKKGKGYKYAENDLDGKWHGIGKFDINTGKLLKKEDNNSKSWSAIISDELYNLMKKNNKIVCITPAMITGSKLEKIFNDFSNRAFDVGIAESHATMLAAGLALNGMRPFISVYSTFSQRAYDQFNHDISRMNLPVVIGLDRAGLVGEDGETHHGVFDISLYRNLPNFIISAPRNNIEANKLLNIAFDTNNPFIIRYPRGNSKLINEYNFDFKIGKWIVIKKHKFKMLITYNEHSNEFEKRLNDNNSFGLIHALFIKPIDYNLLDDLFAKGVELFIYEPEIKGGGFASSILEYANKKRYNINKINIISLEDTFVSAGNNDDLRKAYLIDYDYVIDKILLGE